MTFRVTSTIMFTPADRQQRAGRTAGGEIRQRRDGTGLEIAIVLGELVAPGLDELDLARRRPGVRVPSAPPSF
ncbi:hypothetical protein [Frankia tisae]|uniref:hypothetical protein n=1 Tax=Frankia tisae TaxID=2950104 RepID=UPI0021C1EAAE|nr:hypothetical protein [Frankia tisae]